MLELKNTIVFGPIVFWHVSIAVCPSSIVSEISDI